MEKVYLQYWEESSRTFGITPDGCSLHLLMCDVNTYIESIYNGRENIIPEEYDRIVGDPIVVMISSSIFNELLKANAYKEAAEVYSEALLLDPSNKKLNSILFSNRALTYMKQNQKLRALDDLNKSLELDPKYTKSLVRRAEVHT